MKVTGFSFIRNAIKYQYPVKESILSILPLHIIEDLTGYRPREYKNYIKI